jgi:hypothetical protein
MRFMPAIDLLYGVTRSGDLHIDDFSFSLRLRRLDLWTVAATIFTEAGGTWHYNYIDNIELAESDIGLFSQAAAAS